MSGEVMPSTSTATDAERNQAREEAAVELGKGIALGLVPFLGQAIDAYDTIESAIALYGSGEGEAKETAQFDFLLALVGWIPGPGDGVKKSLRIVNRDPQRFAPVLFDLLRFVLQECGIKTSPEALLDEVFNAGKLRAQLEEIERGVVDSSGFKTLPTPMQDIVKGTLTTAGQNLPVLIGVVQKRVTRWKAMQHNSSSNAVPHGRAKSRLPEARDAKVSAKGQSRGETGHANDGTHGQLATQTLQNITNEAIGISGEHIADYICLERFGWGSSWHAHDLGLEGRWKQPPSTTIPGKLSAGGNPKRGHTLYKLSDGPNGTGIDAVWRASGHNGGKPYAIVEAKATKDEDAPKFFRRPNNTRKPSITSTLGVNAISDPSELLEPLEDDEASQAPASNQRSARRAGAQRGHASKPAPTGATPNKPGRVRDVLVQMSREWIEANLSKAVGEVTARQIQTSYSRHLFYSPAYHPSGSPMAHMRAKLQNLPADQHTHHDAFHYDENEVKSAVNKRKAKLRAKHGNLQSLRAES